MGRGARLPYARQWNSRREGFPLAPDDQLLRNSIEAVIGGSAASRTVLSINISVPEPPLVTQEFTPASIHIQTKIDIQNGNPEYFFSKGIL